MTKRVRPRYVCVYRATKEDAHTYPEHQKGSLLAVMRDGRLFACDRCGIVFWEPLKRSEFADDGRCHGITQVGKRCKLNAMHGSFYCGNHSYLESQSKLVMTNLAVGS